MILALVVILTLSGCVAEDTSSDAVPGDDDTLTIAYWNLFPLDKSGPVALDKLEAVASVLTSYDIIAITGIKDMQAASFTGICDLMPRHKCILSERRGDLSKKERHGIIIKKGYELIDSKDFTYLQTKDFVRPPLSYVIAATNWKFRITLINTDPANVINELRALDMLTQREGMAQTENMVRSEIIVGTLNADCKSLPEKTDGLSTWFWVTPDDADTLRNEQDCAMDRILINHDAKRRYLNQGVGDGIGGVDHLPVYAVFSSV